MSVVAHEVIQDVVLQCQQMRNGCSELKVAHEDDPEALLRNHCDDRAESGDGPAVLQQSTVPVLADDPAEPISIEKRVGIEEPLIGW